MAFLDTLKQRNQILGQPAGGTYGNEMYYGQPPIANTGDDIGGLADTMYANWNKMRNRDLTDFAAKTRITGDEAIRQENLRRIYDPNSGVMTSLRPPNTVYQPSIQEQGQITPIDKAKLDLAKRQIDTEGGLDRATFGLKTKEYELDKLKNDQIFGTKQADMQRKAEEAESRLKLAYDQLQNRQGDASATAAYHQAQIAAQQARMELMAQQHSNDLTETKRLHDAQIKKMQDDLDLARNSTSSTAINPDGTERTVTTKKGTVPIKKSDREGYVRVIDPTGRHGDWPAGKPLPKGFVHIGE